MRSLEEFIMKYKPLDFLLRERKRRDRNMPDLTSFELE